MAAETVGHRLPDLIKPKVGDDRLATTPNEVRGSDSLREQPLAPVAEDETPKL
jgi:hypothetical protein